MLSALIAVTNPFPVKKYGLIQCLKLYKEHILSDKVLLGDLGELRGKALGCWCVPFVDSTYLADSTTECVCHGQILKELINKPPSVNKK